MDGSGGWPGSRQPLRGSDGGLGGGGRRIREEGKMKEVNPKEHTPQLASGDIGLSEGTVLLQHTSFLGNSRPGREGGGKKLLQHPGRGGRRVSGSLHFSMRRGRAPLRDLLPCLTSSQKGLC